MARFSITRLFVLTTNLLCVISFTAANAKEIKSESGAILRKVPARANRTRERVDAGNDYEDGDLPARRGSNRHPPRERLADKLLMQYNIIVPPPSNAVITEFGFSIVSLIDLDYINQILVTSLRLHMRWKDERLAWNPSEFNLIKTFAVPPHRIWRPAVLLRNSADEGIDGAFPISAMVNNKGVVSYNPPGIFKSTCRIDPEELPFDYQNCSLTFGLMHDEGIEKMDLKFYSSEEYLREIILRDYVRNAMWDIVSVRMTHNERMYTGISVPLQDLTFDLELRRRPLYCVWTLVFPILILSYSIPLLLLVPIGSMERIVCTFLVCGVGPGVVRSLVTWVIPNTSESVTMLGKYWLLVSALGLIVIAESVLQIWWVRSRGRRVVKEEDGRQNAKQDGHVHVELSRGNESGSVPTLLDKLLAIVFYMSLTVCNGYLYGTLKYWQDGRPHM